VFKTLYVAHTGKLSYARVWRGEVTDGMNLGGERVSGLYTLLGAQTMKATTAGVGEVVALGKMDHAKTGMLLTPIGAELSEALHQPPPLPVFSRAIFPEKRADDVKLNVALGKLHEEDATITYEVDVDSHDAILAGQGDVHLQIVAEKLKNRFLVPVALKAPRVPYRETIKKGVKEHARYKRQTGGHGQFADVHLEIQPRPRGAGFEFLDNVVGGVVPRNFIPSVEEGSKDATKRGPLGFPVVDISVSLFDGTFHSVDSSDQAFKTATGMCMREGLAKCEPVLLEPIMKVDVSVPRDFTPNAQRLITGRRGHLLGYDAKDGVKDWDIITGHVPQAELNEFIIELRSLTSGLGTFAATFDHYQELVGRVAEKIVAAQADSAAAAHT
jgi:elongation factor G